MVITAPSHTSFGADPSHHCSNRPHGQTVPRLAVWTVAAICGDALTVERRRKPDLRSRGGLSTRVRVIDIPETLAHAHVPTTIVPKRACFERKSFVSGTAGRERLIEMKQP